MTTVQEMIGEVFDASLLEPDDNGELQLPGWLRIYCITDERSVQVSASTALVGMAAHSARAYSADGTNWGLLVEPKVENIITDQAYDGWADIGTPVVANVTTPAATTEMSSIEDDDAAAIEYVGQVFTPIAGATYTVSAWTRVLAPAPTAAAAHGFAGYVGFFVEAVEAAWTYHASDAGVIDTSPAAAYLQPRSVHAADVGVSYVWGAQAERRQYATSFMGADGVTFDHEADTLLATPESIAPDGFFDIEIIYSPQYAHDESSAEHNLLYFDDDNRAFYRLSDTKFVLTIGGVELLSSAVTFSRLQQLTITVRHSPTEGVGRQLIVSGATTGNGTTTAAVADAITLPHMAYVLGTSAGAEDGAVLYKFAPNLSSFADLADERALVQMDDSVGNRKFRDMLRAFAQQAGRFYDVCLTIKAALELDSAIGEQLDKIGAVVGLPREGFTDARYRVFLGIQVDLLLSAQRDDAAWTGTCPNILAITRRFIGRSTFKATDISGCKLWLKADRGITRDGVRISNWEDQSGEGNDTGQTTLANTPAFVEEDPFFSMQPSVHFDGTDGAATAQYLEWPAFPSPGSACDVFMMVRVDADPAGAGAGGGWTLTADAATEHYPFTDGIVYAGVGSTLRKATGNPTLPLTTPHLLEMISLTGEWTMNIAGDQHYTTAVNVFGWLGAGWTLGKDLGDRAWKARVAEMILYDHKLTAADRATVEAHFAAEYSPIIYTAYPPYSYLLQVPGLVLSEAYLLARFLTTANYAAVYGMMIVLISDDSLWESNVAPVKDGGTWDSAVAPLAGAAEWQIVVVTS